MQKSGCSLCKSENSLYKKSPLKKFTFNYLLTELFQRKKKSFPEVQYHTVCILSKYIETFFVLTVETTFVPELHTPKVLTLCETLSMQLQCSRYSYSENLLIKKTANLKISHCFMEY